MRIEQEYALVSTDALKVHPRNPNQGNAQEIERSIRENGWYGAVVAQRSTGYVLAGNHRLQAARLSGADELPVIWLDVDERQATKILLADNRLAELAMRDQEALATLLTELAHDDDLGGTGYDDDDLDALLSEMSEDLDLEDLDVSSQLGELGYRIVIECADECEQIERIGQLEEIGIEFKTEII